MTSIQSIISQADAVVGKVNPALQLPSISQDIVSTNSSAIRHHTSKLVGEAAATTTPSEFRPRSISSQVLLEAMSAVSGASKLTEDTLNANQVISEGILPNVSGTIETLGNLGANGAISAKESIEKLKASTACSSKAEVNDIATGNVTIASANRTVISGNTTSILSDTNLITRAPYQQTIAADVVVQSNNSIVHVSDLHHISGKSASTTVDNEIIMRSKSHLRVSESSETLSRNEKMMAVEGIEQLSTNFVSYATTASVIGLNEVKMQSYGELEARGSNVSLVAAPVLGIGGLDDLLSIGEDIISLGNIDLYSALPGGDINGFTVSAAGVSGVATSSTTYVLGTETRIAGGPLIYQSGPSVLSLGGVTTINTLPPLPIPPLLKISDILPIPELPSFPENFDPCAKPKPRATPTAPLTPTENDTAPSDTAPTDSSNQLPTFGVEDLPDSPLEGNRSFSTTDIPSISRVEGVKQQATPRNRVSSPRPKSSDSTDPRNPPALPLPEQARPSAIAVTPSDVYLRKAEEPGVDSEALSISLNESPFDLTPALTFDNNSVSRIVSDLGLPITDIQELTNLINKLDSGQLSSATGVLADLLNTYPNFKQRLEQEIQKRFAALAIGTLELETTLLPLWKNITVSDNSQRKQTLLSKIAQQLPNLFNELGFNEFTDISSLATLGTELLNGDVSSNTIDTVILNSVGRTLERVLGVSSSSLATATYKVAQQIAKGESIDVASTISLLISSASPALGQIANTVELGQQIYGIATSLASSVSRGDIASIIGGGNLNSIISSGLGSIIGDKNKALLNSSINLIESGFALGKTLSRLPSLIGSITSAGIPALLEIGQILTCLDLFSKVTDVVNDVSTLVSGKPSSVEAVNLLNQLPRVVQLFNTASQLFQQGDNNQQEELLNLLLPDATEDERGVLVDVLSNPLPTLDTPLPTYTLVTSAVVVNSFKSNGIEWSLVNSDLFIDEHDLPGEGTKLQIRVCEWVNTAGYQLYPYQGTDSYTTEVLTYIVSDYDESTNVGQATYAGWEPYLKLVDDAGIIYNYSASSIGTRINPNVLEAYIL